MQAVLIYAVFTAWRHKVIILLGLTVGVVAGMYSTANRPPTKSSVIVRTAPMPYRGMPATSDIAVMRDLLITLRNKDFQQKMASTLQVEVPLCPVDNQQITLACYEAEPAGDGIKFTILGEDGQFVWSALLQTQNLIKEAFVNVYRDHSKRQIDAVEWVVETVSKLELNNGKEYSLVPLSEFLLMQRFPGDRLEFAVQKEPSTPKNTLLIVVSFAVLGLIASLAIVFVWAPIARMTPEERQACSEKVASARQRLI